MKRTFTFFSFFRCVLAAVLEREEKLKINSLSLFFVFPLIRSTKPSRHVMKSPKKIVVNLSLKLYQMRCISVRIPLMPEFSLKKCYNTIMSKYLVSILLLH